jgi:pyrroline-5-carboxylate reductase
MTNTITCIGSGNMGFALMKGIKSVYEANYHGTVKVFFSDADTGKAQAAAAAITGEMCYSNIEAAGKGEYIFLAVKPQILPQVLSEISPVIQKRQNENSTPVIVSMAAGWSIERIQAALCKEFSSPSSPPCIVRIMPNTPALIGKGMIPLAASPEVPAAMLSKLEIFLKGAGIVDHIDYTMEESFMDAITGLSGSGPAFVYFFIEALAEGGVCAGLPKDKALFYATQTVLGAAAMVQETGKNPGELIDMVTSPSGTTVAGLNVLNESEFRSITINAVKAAWQRAIQLCSG